VLEERCGVRVELRPPDGEERRCDAPAGIGDSEPDGLGAEIEAQQRAVRRERAGELCD
jgi:hypothetical protein